MMGLNASGLSGTLVDVRPRTLLHFLGLTGKTGVLEARRHDRRAAVRLARGGVSGGVGGDALDAVVELLRFGNGEFSFVETACGEAGEEEGEPVPALLARADELLVEWENVGQAVPCTALTVRLRPAEMGTEDVRLSADAWTVSGAVGVTADRCTPGDLAGHLGWDRLRTYRAITELVESGCAELLPTPTERALRGPATVVVTKAERPLWPGASVDSVKGWRTPWYDPGD